MKEDSILTHLGRVLTQQEVTDAMTYIKSNRLLFVNRPYMCDEQVGGYPLAYVCQKSQELDSIIKALEQALLSTSHLDNTRIIERGIGISPEDLSFDNVVDSKEIALLSKQVRIPLSGISKINDELLGLGLAYIVDTVSGYSFSASKDSTHLVFNFLSNDEVRKPWELWKNREL